MSELATDEQSFKYIKMWIHYFHKDHPTKIPDESYWTEWLEFLDLVEKELYVLRSFKAATEAQEMDAIKIRVMQ